MKSTLSLNAAIVLVLLGLSSDALAANAHRPPAHATKRTTTHPRPAHAAAPMPCQVSINAKEDREVVIMKLTQRLDCLENKVNHLSEQLFLQTKGAVRPFTEPSKEFVIKYPHDDSE